MTYGIKTQTLNQKMTVVKEILLYLKEESGWHQPPFFTEHSSNLQPLSPRCGKNLMAALQMFYTQPSSQWLMLVCKVKQVDKNYRTCSSHVHINNTHIFANTICDDNKISPFPLKGTIEITVHRQLITFALSCCALSWGYWRFFKRE